MKVLFVGGGRRISLAKRFIDAGFEVMAYETDLHAPICSVATIIVGLKWGDARVDEDIITVCKQNNIDIAIPLQDAATVVLSRNHDELAEVGTKVPTATESVNTICLNKKLFEAKLLDNAIYPAVTDDCSKVILKPIFGFNSKGIKIVSRDEYLKTKTQTETTHVAQRFIEAGVEFSVDAYFNRQSKMVDAVSRIRAEVQGGEVSKSKTVDRAFLGLVSATKDIGESIGLVGPACFQYVVGSDEVPYIMEINARFGGGVILSLEAGLNIVDLIKREYINGEELYPKQYDWKTGFSMVRYFSEHFHDA